MAVFFGRINFDNWNDKDSIKVERESASCKIISDFISFNISFLPEENPENNYCYNSELNIAIFIQGKICLNELPSDQIPSAIIDSYKKDPENFLINIPGFFSLIILDINKRQVLLASDSIGLNKTYYSYTKNEFLFSSEIRKLLKHNRGLSKEGSIQFLLTNYTVDTIYEDVKVVKPSSIVSASPVGINSQKYFNLIQYLSEGCQALKKNSSDEISLILKNIVKEYSNNNKTLVTLTSGYDSRLLLSAVLANSIKPKAFTFGIEDNIEFKIAEEISEKLNIDYFQIKLDNKFEQFLPGYFDYLKETKNIDLNFNRYHYFYTWKRLQNEKGIVFTGICGDSFTRNGLSRSYATNELLYNLIYTENKNLLIKNYVKGKKYLIEAAGFSEKDSLDALTNMFSEIENNNKYKNHFIIKIEYAVRKYFAAEYNMENKIKQTFPVFLDLRYLTALANSEFSIFNNRFLDNNNRYKIISHKYYYFLIKNLYNDLNNFNTNRGFPLKYSSSLFYLPFRLVSNLRQKKSNYKTDLNYAKWKKLIDLDKNYDYEDSLKLRILSSIN